VSSAPKWEREKGESGGGYLIKGGGRKGLFSRSSQERGDEPKFISTQQQKRMNVASQHFPTRRGTPILRTAREKSPNS